MEEQHLRVTSSSFAQVVVRILRFLLLLCPVFVRFLFSMMADLTPGGFPWENQTYLDRLTVLGEENPFEKDPGAVPVGTATPAEGALPLKDYLRDLRAYMPDALGPRDGGGMGYLQEYYEDFPEPGPYNTHGQTYIDLDPPSFMCWQRQLERDFLMDQGALNVMWTLTTLDNPFGEPEYLRALQFLIKDREFPLRNINTFSMNVVMECRTAMLNPTEWDYQDPEGLKGHNKGKGKGKLHEVPGPRPCFGGKGGGSWYQGGQWEPRPHLRDNWGSHTDWSQGAWNQGGWHDWGAKGKGREGFAQGGWRGR